MLQHANIATFIMVSIANTIFPMFFKVELSGNIEPTGKTACWQS